MNFNKYIVETSGVYFNTVTKKQLPLSSSEEDFRKNYFLEGQEEDAILSKINAIPEGISMTYIPTWECNLRCNHCSVLHLLKKKDETTIDLNDYVLFVEKLINRFDLKYILIQFAGGEPLLKPEECIKIIDLMNQRFSDKLYLEYRLTTNLAVDLNEDVIKFLNLCNTFAVSVDGTEEQHNWQRKSLEDFNPYLKTEENIKKLISLGFKNKLQIKSAIRQSKTSEQEYESFLERMASLDVEIDNIEYYSVHSTSHHKELMDIEGIKESLANQKREKPCCKFQKNNHFIVYPDGSIFDSFFSNSRNSIGNLKDDLDSILEKRKKIIEESFCYYTDSACKNCPAIGYCWGGCINNYEIIKNNPSNYCNREELTKRILNAASKNELF